MYLGYRIYETAEDIIAFAQQTGAEAVLLPLDRTPSYKKRGFPVVSEILELRERFEKHGLVLFGMTVHRPELENVLLGNSERDRDIENVCKSLEALGKAGINTMAYDLIFSLVGHAPGRWRNPGGRGGAVYSSFDYDRALAEMDAPVGQISADQAWERIQYLYERIVPAAEEAGVNLACHPDDPPVAHYRGVEQVLNSVEGLKKLTEEIAPSPRNGLLYCAGTVMETGADIYKATDYFLGKGKIFITHFRNVRGTIPKYDEVFLDEGDADMYRLMQLYVKHNHQGLLVPDHSVGIVNDTQWGHISRAWSLSHMIALRKAAQEKLGRV